MGKNPWRIVKFNFHRQIRLANYLDYQVFMRVTIISQQNTSNPLVIHLPGLLITLHWKNTYSKFKEQELFRMEVASSSTKIILKTSHCSFRRLKNEFYLIWSWATGCALQSKLTSVANNHSFSKFLRWLKTLDEEMNMQTINLWKLWKKNKKQYSQ